MGHRTKEIEVLQLSRAEAVFDRTRLYFECEKGKTLSTLSNFPTLSCQRVFPRCGSDPIERVKQSERKFRFERQRARGVDRGDGQTTQIRLDRKLEF